MALGACQCRVEKFRTKRSSRRREDNEGLLELAALRLVDRNCVSEFKIVLDTLRREPSFCTGWDLAAVIYADLVFSCELDLKALQAPLAIAGENPLKVRPVDKIGKASCREKGCK